MILSHVGLQLYELGMIPYGICLVTNLQSFNTGIDGVTCSPLCVSSISSTSVPSTVCLYPQDNALCGLIAATNIHLVSGYSQWSCTTAGFTSTNPCSQYSGVWLGLSCNGMNVVSINLYGLGISGVFAYRLCIQFMYSFPMIVFLY